MLLLLGNALVTLDGKPPANPFGSTIALTSVAMLPGATFGSWPLAAKLATTSFSLIDDACAVVNPEILDTLDGKFFTKDPTCAVDDCTVVDALLESDARSTVGGVNPIGVAFAVFAIDVNGLFDGVPNALTTFCNADPPSPLADADVLLVIADTADAEFGRDIWPPTAVIAGRLGIADEDAVARLGACIATPLAIF